MKTYKSYTSDTKPGWSLNDIADKNSPIRAAFLKEITQNNRDHGLELVQATDTPRGLLLIYSELVV
jgi:hypothetical protein